MKHVLIAAIVLIAGIAQAAGKNQPEAEKAGGIYEVKEIEKKAGDTFTIRFEAIAKTGRFDVLVLETDHVHVGVEVGAQLRLSAQIISEQGATAEVAQVLLFLPVGQSHVPVWLLSKKAPAGELRGSKYLEMHAPTADYTIL